MCVHFCNNTSCGVDSQADAAANASSTAAAIAQQQTAAPTDADSSGGLIGGISGLMKTVLQHSFFFGAFRSRSPSQTATLADEHDLDGLRFLMELSLFTGCIALGMLTWHAWLVLTAQTSVEYRANKFREGEKPMAWYQLLCECFACCIVATYTACSLD